MSRYNRRRDCDKRPQVAPTCVNCGGAHAANARSCTYLKQRTSTAKNAVLGEEAAVPPPPGEAAIPPSVTTDAAVAALKAAMAAKRAAMQEIVGLHRQLQELREELRTLQKKTPAPDATTTVVRQAGMNVSTQTDVAPEPVAIQETGETPMDVVQPVSPPSPPDVEEKKTLQDKRDQEGGGMHSEVIPFPDVTNLPVILKKIATMLPTNEAAVPGQVVSMQVTYAAAAASRAPYQQNMAEQAGPSDARTETGSTAELTKEDNQNLVSNDVTEDAPRLPSESDNSSNERQASSIIPDVDMAEYDAVVTHERANIPEGTTVDGHKEEVIQQKTDNHTDDRIPQTGSGNVKGKGGAQEDEPMTPPVSRVAETAATADSEINVAQKSSATKAGQAEIVCGLHSDHVELEVPQEEFNDPNSSKDDQCKSPRLYTSEGSQTQEKIGTLDSRESQESSESDENKELTEFLKAEAAESSNEEKQKNQRQRRKPTWMESGEFCMATKVEAL
ncbi:neurofilament heavy polypeptide-like [Schistocerca nitens]|uniref:neurofilament heavy polypeptide-like n=1 Tax=Schistocerca nitens TaxID=7011 RepID=UPI002118EC2B|nr:neurofilament heavy polypeptide-like [Schistocerca nitens]